MKWRSGFVSNSSSCSFTVLLDDLSANQLVLVQDWKANAKRLAENPHSTYKPYFLPENDYDEWSVEISDGAVRFGTTMDNFDMAEYLYAIGVPPDKIIDWGEY